MLRRPSAGRALWPLDSDGTPPTRLVRPLLRPLGISRRLHRAPPARHSHLHRVTRRNRAHAPRPLPHLHLPGVLVVVLRPGLARHETGPELARTRKVFPPVRCGDRCSVGGGCGVFYLDSLARPDRQPALSGRPSVRLCRTVSPAATPRSATYHPASSPHPYTRSEPGSALH